MSCSAVQRAHFGLQPGARLLAGVQRLLEIGVAPFQGLDLALGAGQLLLERITLGLRGRQRAGCRLDALLEGIVARLQRGELIVQLVTLAVQSDDLSAQLRALGLQLGHRPAQALARRLQSRDRVLRFLELGLRFGLEGLVVGAQGSELSGERVMLGGARAHFGLQPGARLLAGVQRLLEIGVAPFQGLDLALGAGQLLLERITLGLRGRQRAGCRL